jgi:hypothetical protein
MGSNSETERRLALVIVVDGLRASALGAYGNTAIPTPQFDELASRSLVVEWLLVESPTLRDFYRNALSGLQGRDTRRWLVTDDASIVADSESGLFEEFIAVEPGQQRRARRLEATHAAAFFSHAVEQLALWQKDTAEHPNNGLLWVHFSGLSGPWDAPLTMRNELLDEDDPPAPEFVSPPGDLRGITDPDELLGYRVAYAAQNSIIEMCLTGLVEAFEGMPTKANKLAMIAGSRGFALGEHGYVGHDCQILFSEQLHMPWLIMSDQTGVPLPRVTGFAQPADIGVTLAQWLSGGGDADAALGRSLLPFLNMEPGRLRDAVVAANAAGEQIIRTPAWLMKQGISTELYAKPDDRWEANDVASRCPEIIEQLSKHLEAIRAGTAGPLSDELVSPWR